MGNRAPAHGTIQNCSIYLLGVCPNNSARLPIYATLLVLGLRGVPSTTALPHVIHVAQWSSFKCMHGTGVLHSVPGWKGLQPQQHAYGGVAPAAPPETRGVDEPRAVHVKVIELKDSAAAGSAWRELVMLLQVRLSALQSLRGSSILLFYIQKIARTNLELSHLEVPSCKALVRLLEYALSHTLRCIGFRALCSSTSLSAAQPLLHSGSLNCRRCPVVSRCEGLSRDTVSSQDDGHRSTRGQSLCM